jgi:phage baseplate assembly protein W
MALTQRFGVKYPFSSNNLDEIYIDLNETLTDRVKSEVLHVLFTPKGQKLRNPDFGTDLIKYLFDPKDDTSFESVKSSIKMDIGKYVKNIEFEDIRILQDENDERAIIVVVEYSVVKGNKKEKTKVAVKL